MNLQMLAPIQGSLSAQAFLNDLLIGTFSGLYLCISALLASERYSFSSHYTNTTQSPKKENPHPPSYALHPQQETSFTFSLF